MGSNIIEEVRNVITRESEAIQNIPITMDYGDAVDLIYECVHKNKGRVIASGMGKAGQIADNIATTFSSTGTPATFLHPSEAQHGDLGLMRENDVLLVLSNSGKTREIIELVELSHNLYETIPVIVITGNPDSLLPAMANVTIFTGNPPEVCALGLTPTTSTTTMTVIGDVLVVLLMKKIGFTAIDYAKRHHGGYLGIRSRNQANGHEDSKE
jgi:arabinose-5-phosphate isomerase